MPRAVDTIKFLTLDETKRLFSVIEDKRDKALFLIAYRHGLRASEVGLLQVSDLDLKQLRIIIHRLKGSLGGQHPLQADEAKAIKAYLKARSNDVATRDSPILFPSNRNVPISRKTLDWMMREKYGKLARLPEDKRHFHVLKHSIATHLLDAGADVIFLKDWLGHSNIQNTMIYTHLVSSTRDQKARTHFMKLPRF
jgi:site-specific recombinase XerD